MDRGKRIEFWQKIKKEIAIRCVKLKLNDALVLLVQFCVVSACFVFCFDLCRIYLLDWLVILS